MTFLRDLHEIWKVQAAMGPAERLWDSVGVVRKANVKGL
jgi:hypothetical protein